MKLRTLTFDTETLSLVKDWKTPVDKMTPEQLANEPLTLQVAWIVNEIDTETLEIIELETFKAYVQPSTSYPSFTEQNFENNEAVKVNGISWQMCIDSEFDMKSILQKMRKSIDEHNVDCLLAHNAQFDVKVLQCELKRIGINDWLSGLHIICTKILFKGFADAAGIRATLESAYRYFNDGQIFDNAHDAFADVNGCYNVFIGCCKKLNMWPLPDSVLCVAAYSNGWHEHIPASIWQQSGWHSVAEIDLVQGKLSCPQAYTVKKMYIKQEQYAEECLRHYNVDIEACKVGYEMKTALHLLNVYIQFSRLVIFHGAQFHVGLLNAQYMKHKAIAADNYVSGVVNALWQKPWFVDCNVLGSIMLPNLCVRPNYIRREDIYEHFAGKQPTSNVIAALSIYYNFIWLHNECVNKNDIKPLMQSYISTSNLK